jgi:hypothetical protein
VENFKRRKLGEKKKQRKNNFYKILVPISGLKYVWCDISTTTAHTTAKRKKNEEKKNTTTRKQEEEKLLINTQPLPLFIA